MISPWVWEAAPNFYPLAQDSSPKLQRSTGRPARSKKGTNRKGIHVRESQPVCTLVPANGSRESETAVFRASLLLFRERKGTNKFSSVLRILHSCLLTKQRVASISTLPLSFLPDEVCHHPLQGTFLGNNWPQSPLPLS